MQESPLWGAFLTGGLSLLLQQIHECIKCNQCIKYKSVMKFIPVSAPGTLGIYQTLIWTLVSKWFLGDIVLTMVLTINVSLYCQMSIWIIYVFNVYVYQNYSGHLQYGVINILLYLIYMHGIMVYWGF